MQHPALSPGGGTKPGAALAARPEAAELGRLRGRCGTASPVPLGQPGSVKVPGEVSRYLGWLGPG